MPTGVVTERMRDNLEDEGQLPLHHRDKNTGDHLPVVFMDFPVLECEWIEYSDIDINTRSYRQGVDVYADIARFDIHRCDRVPYSGTI